MLLSESCPQAPSSIQRPMASVIGPALTMRQWRKQASHTLSMHCVLAHRLLVAASLMVAMCLQVRQETLSMVLNKWHSSADHVSYT